MPTCNTRLWNGEGQLHARRLRLHQLHRAGLPGSRPSVTTRRPSWPASPIGLPTDMPKAWFVALASLSKARRRGAREENADADHVVVAPAVKKTRLK